MYWVFHKTDTGGLSFPFSFNQMPFLEVWKKLFLVFPRAGPTLFENVLIKLLYTGCLKTKVQGVSKNVIFTNQRGEHRGAVLGPRAARLEGRRPERKVKLRVSEVCLPF
jgi:hypothetical protein